MRLVKRIRVRRVGEPRIRFVHFAALPISRLIARRGHIDDGKREARKEDANRGCRGTAAHERLALEGGGSRGWGRGIAPADKRIAASASLRNSITGAALRNPRALLGGCCCRRHHAEHGSVPFQSNERTHGAALYKVRKFQFNLFSARLPHRRPS